MRRVIYFIVTCYMGFYPLFAQFGKNKVQYYEFEWFRYESLHFVVYYYKGAENLLTKIVSFAESAYDELSRKLNYSIDEKINLIYYATFSHFEQTNVIGPGFVPEGALAFATPVKKRMVLPADLPDPELYQLITHELTHIFQYHMILGENRFVGTGFMLPAWLMEGMASYFAKDETSSDKMFLRDAVVNHRIPNITESRGFSFFAYRIGHAVFDFIEEKWGVEGIRDFLLNLRTMLRGGVSRAIKRSFGLSSEQFNLEFARWLRKRYLPLFAKSGPPDDYGQPISNQEGFNTSLVGLAVSPGGELGVTFGVVRGEVDVYLLNLKKRTVIRNLTKGFNTVTGDFVAQMFTTGRSSGNDLAFSPDGNLVAVFAKKEGKRVLVLLNVIKGGIHKVIPIELDQPRNPVFHPKKMEIYFSAAKRGQFDIFKINLENFEVENVTNDEYFDLSPAISHDGSKLVYVSSRGKYMALYIKEGNEASKPLIRGKINVRDPVFSPDGKRVYFTGDLNDTENIYYISLEENKIFKLTDLVTGAFMPAIARSKDGDYTFAFTSLWNGVFGLYVADVKKPLEVSIESVEEKDTFEPPLEIYASIDRAKKYKRSPFFLQDASGGVGVTSDGILISQLQLFFSDILGDKQILAFVGSADTFSQVDLFYLDIGKRWQKGVRVFDRRLFFVTFVEDQSGNLRLLRRNVFTLTGLSSFAFYPLDKFNRLELAAGYLLRDYELPVFRPDTGEVVIFEVSDNFPFINAAFVRDNAKFAPWGAIAGNRMRIEASYGIGSKAASQVSFDIRGYMPVSLRSNFAFRLFGAASYGDNPNVIFFGGTDDFRGVRYASFSGDRAFFVNLEYRFPLVDRLHLPFMHLNNIRGRIFVDVAGAWFDSLGEDFVFWDSTGNKLQDAKSVYGFGVSFAFQGIWLHWDFSKRWDFKNVLDDSFNTSFWIGTRF